jgi:glutamine synthetase
VRNLPGDLNEAVTALEADEVVRATLGEHVFEHFVTAKRAEWHEYSAVVHDWELRRYLDEV